MTHKRCLDLDIASGPALASLLRNFFVFFAVVLAVSTFLAPGVSAESEGCYLFPAGDEDLVCQDGILDTLAQEDCDLYGDCSMASHFAVGQSCSEFEACELITCSIDCDLHSRASCEALGGFEISASQFDLWCTEGCCQVGSFCEFVSTRGECLNWAERQGLSESDMAYISDGVDPFTCSTTICGSILEPASITGTVSDSFGDALQGVELRLSVVRITQSQEDGSYTFTDVNPGSYLLELSLEGYESQSISLDLVAGEERELDLVLDALGSQYPVSIETVDSFGNPLSQVRLCYEGPQSDCVISDDSGIITVELFEGNYDFIFTKVGFQSVESSVTINSEYSEQVVLDEATIQGIQGSTWLDTNGDGTADEAIYGAQIYVDGRLVGNSFYPDARFEVFASAGEHSLQARYASYSSDLQTVTVTAGSVSTVGQLLLEEEIGECSYGQENDQKPVAALVANHVQGRASVVLEWDRPCNEVAGYILHRDGEGFLTLPASTVRFEDDSVSWGESYTYDIWALYVDGPDGSRQSSSSAQASITLGSELCETIDAGYQFCRIDDASTAENERKFLYTCSAENQLQAFDDCSTRDSSNSQWYCSGQDGVAVCKDAGVCSVLVQEATPFGLYFERDACYGSVTATGPETFCYYDNGPSISNVCESCLEVESCFDYQSADACGVNSCLSSNCEWIPATSTVNEEGSSDDFLDYSPLFPTSQETGHGFCVEQDYEEDTYCSLCGPGGDLFENDLCTPTVCSALGSCFSDELQSQCSECGQEPTEVANCYEYESEFECQGSAPVSFDNGHRIVSQDSCSWNVCRWQDDSSSSLGGYCVKDADADLVDDCSEFSEQGGEYLRCKTDITAPETEIIGEQLVVSQSQSTISFAARDSQNSVASLFICLAATESPQCDEFVELEYLGFGSEQELSLDLLDPSLDFGISLGEISGQNYVLRYYSEDQFNNRESVKESALFIDTLAPEFSIASQVETSDALSDVAVYVESLSEPASCQFELDSQLPNRPLQSQSRGREEEKVATFDSVDILIAEVTVECTDDYGNTQSHSEGLVINVDNSLELIYPAYGQVIDETTISFEVATLVPAQCGLYNSRSQELIAPFTAQDSSQQVHRSAAIPGFFEGEHVGDVQVICQEARSGETFESLFFFEVDFTAPQTIAILREGAREVQARQFGWEEYFVSSVEVELRCDAQGFACDETFYCLGPACELTANPNYQLYEGPFSLEESTELCYYSSDTGSSTSYATCGSLYIDGFGIHLIRPEPYYYYGGSQQEVLSSQEVRGASDVDQFDWQIASDIDTLECRFDFSDSFNYDSLAPFKHFTALDSPDNNYLYSPFPGEVIREYPSSGGVKDSFVQCLDTHEALSPLQAMHLEFDPSAPRILGAQADPQEVLDGISTQLTVETDDATVCRFSDNSDGQGSIEFETMEFSFPGYSERIVTENHNTEFFFEVLGSSADFSLNVLCMNAAGLVSELEEISFSVDYTQSGSILSLSPQGDITTTDVTLSVETSKNAQCSYDGIVFEETGSRSHSHALGILDEGEYQYLVRCVMGEEVRESELFFTIDLTAPRISSVEDGQLSCSLTELPIFIYSDETDISSYSYQLFREGLSSSANANSSSNQSAPSFGRGTLVSQGVLPQENVTIISDLTLEENASYYVQVSAIDAAGNQGQSQRSNGVTAVTDEDPRCLVDSHGPELRVQTNSSSCFMATAQVLCTDETACSQIQVGQSQSSSSCEADQSYYGQQLEFSSTGWLCYSAVDTAGNQENASYQVQFSDSDGDGVSNSCDECPSSPTGSSVDAFGCASSQGTAQEEEQDQDSDGLPDYWEGLYDQVGCELSFASSDSNGNGILDRDEDYDNDGIFTFEEYLAGTNPCDFEAVEDVIEEQGGFVADDSGLSETNSGESTLVAWLLLLLALFLILGSGGYLLYFYLQDPKGKSVVMRSGIFDKESYSFASPSSSQQFSSRSGAAMRQQRMNSSRPITSAPRLQSQSTVTTSPRSRPRLRSKRHTAIFDSFTSSTKSLPHFEDILSRKQAKSPLAKQHLRHLEDLNSRYTESKTVIKKGIRPEEKDLFAKLDSISKGVKKGTPIEELASPREARDIFSELRELSDKRKKKSRK